MTRWRLVADWRTVLRRAWSVRLALAAALFTSAASWWTFRYYDTPLWVTFPAVVLNFAVAVARVIKQGYSGDNDG